MYKTLFNTHPDATLPTLEKYLASISFSKTLTHKMAKYSYLRTRKHQTLVLNNIQVLLQQNLRQCLSLDETSLSDTAFEQFKTELIQRGKNHDSSKFFDPENTPYVYINWKHHLEKDLKKEYVYPNEMNQEKIDKAIQHHWQVNSHHANYYFIKEDGTLETKVVKIQEKLKNMTNADLIEMVADWMALSQEYQTECKEFAENNIGENKRWPFSQEQKIKIFTIIDTLEQALQAIDGPSSQQAENTAIKLGR